jgi:lysozyme family protein
MEIKVAQFEPAFQFMMGHEDAARSGIVTHDGDGRTRFGICEKFHHDLPEEFWTASPLNAFSEAENIYKDEYWDVLDLDEIVDQAVASKIFDMSVVMGCKEAAILAQRAANGLLLGSSKAPAIDGKIGPHTTAALNSCPPQNLVEALCNLSKIFFCEDAAKHPEKQDDLHGWLNRAAAIPPHMSAPPLAMGADA